MAEEKSKTVYIWDPNGLNPYGQEVYATIRGLGVSSTIWIPKGVTLLFAESNNVRAVLGRSVSEDGFVEHVIRRFTMPLLFIFQAVKLKQPVVLVWTRGLYENVLFAIAALFTRVDVIHHNPVKSRMGRWTYKISFEVLLKSAQGILVHSQRFVRSQPAEANKYKVVVHPLYDSWARIYGADKSQGGSKIRVLVLGALRPDKGTGHLNSFAKALDPDRYALIIVGSGKLPDGFEDICLQRGLELTANVSVTPVADAAIAHGLNNADVLLAPYTDATVSGSIIMAETFGLPSVAYGIGAIGDELAEAALTNVPEPKALVSILDFWAERRFSTYNRSLAERRELIARTWSTAICEI